MRYILVILLLGAYPASQAENGRQWKIGGGNFTAPHEYPSVAALFVTRRKQFFCTGSLIWADTVLTAAHCFKDFKKHDSAYLKKVQLYVVLGIHDINSTHGTAILAKQIILHEKFDRNSNRNPNDVALIKLTRSVNESDTIKYAKLPAQGKFTKPPYNATVVGWGYTKDKQISKFLKKGELSIVDNKKCADNWKQNYHLLLKPMYLCTIHITGRACNGDSGGPLFELQTQNPNTISNEIKSVELIQIGIMNFGDGCSSVVKEPDVYTAVNQFANWIEGKRNNANYLTPGGTGSIITLMVFVAFTCLL